MCVLMMEKGLMKQGDGGCCFDHHNRGRTFAAIRLILTVNKIKTDILAGNREIKQCIFL